MSKRIIVMTAKAHVEVIKLHINLLYKYIYKYNIYYIMCIMCLLIFIITL